MNDHPRPALDQGSHDQEIQDFYHFIENNRQRGVRLIQTESTSSCPFGFSYCDWIAVTELEEYLTSTKITQVLQSVYGKHKRLPVDADFVEEGCLKIFAILLLIKKGSFIQYFVENALWDVSLPFANRPANFPELANSPDDFWPEFQETQWKLCAHVFRRRHVNTRLDKNIILPITQWEKLVENGDSGTVCKIRIHPDYHMLRDDENRPLPHPSYDPNVFVIKSFSGTNPRRLNYYNSEVEAFKILGCNTRHAPAEIVSFYGSFIQNGTHNILLEYADGGTLEQYFREQGPPDESEDIISFWSSIKGLTTGLANIHTAALPEIHNNTDMFYGYHQDLKPSNILVFTYGADSPYRYRFKIADLGLSHFVQTRYPMSDVNGEGNPGTRTYGAPETNQAQQIDPHHMRFAQKSDVWSLACICSVAASWVVGGQNRIDRYSMARQQARRDLRLAESDCFHDDFRVLQVVQDWHERVLVDRASRIDYITGRLWSMVLKRAFSAIIGDRLWADQLHFAMIELIKAPNPPSPPHTPPDQGHGRWTSMSPSTSAPFFEEPRDVGDSEFVRPPRSNTQSTRTPRKMTIPAYNSPPLTNDQRSTFGQTQSHTSRQSLGESSSRIPADPATSSTPDNLDLSSQEGDPNSPIGYAQASKSSQFFNQRGADRPIRANERNIIADSREIPFRTPSQSQRYNASTNVRSQSGVAEFAHSNQQTSRDPNSRYRYDSMMIMPTNSEVRGPIQDENIGFSRPTAMEAEAEDPPASFASDLAGQHPSTHKTFSGNPGHSNAQVPCPRHGTHGRDIEYMSVQDLLDWYHSKKPVPYAGLKEELKKRDHVFIIDDAISMKPYWPHVVQLFAVLAKFIKDCDDDGIELFFTVNRQERQKQKNTTSLIQKVKSLEGILSASSEPATVLREIFDDKRCRTLREGKRKFGRIGPVTDAPLTVYIFTDGMWQPSTNLWPEISRIVDLLERPEAKGPKHVGIQFIQFGDDRQLTDRLTAYDDSNLRRDIVDREPCDGNAWKMLLGSVNTSFDKANDPCTCGLGSQTRPYHTT